MITKFGTVSFIIFQFIYVIYQQTSITIQYKINLKCMFKDILYPTLLSLQNHTLDGRIMYLTGTLVLLFNLELFKLFKQLKQWNKIYIL